MDDKKPIFNEIHYVDMISQSNVYGLAKLSATGNTEDNKLIVASLNGNFQCLYFDKELLTCKTTTIPFTYIPEIDSEIIAIDIFSQKGNFHGIVIGITFTKIIKAASDPPSNFLNIYSEFSEDRLLDLERISQGCQSLPLSFLSYKLYHTDIMINEDYMETLFLLSGSDNKIHCYKMEDNEFIEVNVEKYFPEFHNPPAVVLSMCCLLDTNLKIRTSAFGCRTGYVGVYVLNAVNNDILQTFFNDVDCPITSLSFFYHIGSVEDKQKNQSTHHPYNVHLLVTNSFYPSFVYLNVYSPPKAILTPNLNSFIQINEDILTTHKHFNNTNEPIYAKESPNLINKSESTIRDLDKQDYLKNDLPTVDNVSFAQLTVNPIIQQIALLPNSCDHDCVLSTLIYDIDLDGYNEIIIGTYSGKLLVYKLIGVSSLRNECNNKKESGNSKDMKKESGNSKAMKKESHISEILENEFRNSSAIKKSLNEYSLVYSWDFSDGILNLQFCDLTGDGLLELVVLTVNGLHILQHDLEEVANLLTERMNNLNFKLYS